MGGGKGRGNRAGEYAAFVIEVKIDGLDIRSCKRVTHAENLLWTRMHYQPVKQDSRLSEWIKVRKQQ